MKINIYYIGLKNSNQSKIWGYGEDCTNVSFNEYRANSYFAFWGSKNSSLFFKSVKYNKNPSKKNGLDTSN